MKRVIRIDNYIQEREIEGEKCEWDAIANIFKNKFEELNLTKEQIQETSQKLLREVRTEINNEKIGK